VDTVRPRQFEGDLSAGAHGHRSIGIKVPARKVFVLSFLFFAVTASVLCSPVAGQDRPDAALSHVVAVQFPWYWTRTDDGAKRRCIGALDTRGLRRPGLLQAFEIVLVLDPPSGDDLTTRELINKICPGAAILASATLSDEATSLAIPTNRVIFETCDSLGEDRLRKLLPGVTLKVYSQTNACQTYTADVRTGPATKAERVAQDLARVDGIKYAQVNTVHLTLTKSAFSRK
jgi:hypothetical protein